MFNKQWFDSQPKENQEILVKTMKEAGQWEREAMMDRDAETTQRIKAAGVQVNTLTPEAREQFRQASLTVHERFSEQIGKDFLQRLYAEIEKASR